MQTTFELGNNPICTKQSSGIHETRNAQRYSSTEAGRKSMSCFYAHAWLSCVYISAEFRISKKEAMARTRIFLCIIYAYIQLVSTCVCVWYRCFFLPGALCAYVRITWSLGSDGIQLSFQEYRRRGAVLSSIHTVWNSSWSYVRQWRVQQQSRLRWRHNDLNTVKESSLSNCHSSIPSKPYIPIVLLQQGMLHAIALYS